MCGEEYKSCPRYHAPFMCNAGSISRCQCSTVELDRQERNYIQEHYEDCLCARCLVALKAEYNNTVRQNAEIKN